MIARMTATKEGIVEFGFMTCYINKHGAPEVLKNYADAKFVIDYVEKISAEQKLKIQLEWQEDGWVKVRE